jgi:aminoglycoside 3-N-acetyltransferase
MNSILSTFPLLEVFLRFLYWFLNPLLTKKQPKNKKKLKSQNTHPDVDNFFLNLKSIGIEYGDALLIHTSSDILDFLNLQPNNFIEKLYNLVGLDGAILVNTSRQYDYQFDSVFNKYKIFDIDTLYEPKKTLVSTGIIPYALLRRKDSICSFYPINSICGIGGRVKEFLEYDELKDYSTFSDINSEWHKLYKDNVKVLCFGIQFENCCTVMHVAEDIRYTYGENYSNWYYLRKFNLKIDDKIQSIYIRHLKPIFGKIFYCRNKFRNDMIVSGVVKIFNNEGFFIEYYNCKEFVNTIIDNKNPKYPYFYTKIIL